MNMDPNPDYMGSRTTGRTVLFVILALILLLVVGFGVWYWQRQEVNRLNERIELLEGGQVEEIERLNDRIRQLEDDLAAALEELEQETNSENETATNEHTSPKGVFILVDTPRPGERVASPLRITGRVPGNWSFEADFPVRLEDSNGNVLAEEPATLLGDWMTEELVAFEAILTFTSPGTGTGQLVLIKDNPSGLSENDDSVSIGVRF